ncbi:MAG: transglycosylase SLT domain-containing protein [Pseudomonadota bacterium]
MSNANLSSISLPQAGHTAGGAQARAAVFAERARSGAARQVTNASSTQVEQAIAKAARSTSVAFDYLVAQAQVESAMNPQARAQTSSASGLYQFIESTWLNTVKRHGERFGLGDIADRISISPSGSAYVTDPAQRAAILNLRNDPEVASLMAAGLAEDNRADLTSVLGRQPEANELYLAHFLGAGGASRFLSAMQSNPDQSAANLFRRPAAANRAVFYEPNGASRSLGGVMNYLGAKMDRALAMARTGDHSKGNFPDHVASFAPRYSANPNYSEREHGVPYRITTEEVFAPANPPAIAGGAPTVRSRSMSRLLGSSVEASGARQVASPEAVERIRRAYERLRVMGL